MERPHSKPLDQNTASESAPIDEGHAIEGDKVWVPPHKEQRRMMGEGGDLRALARFCFWTLFSIQAFFYSLVILALLEITSVSEVFADSFNSLIVVFLYYVLIANWVIDGIVLSVFGLLLARFLSNFEKRTAVALLLLNLVAFLLRANL